MKTKNLIAGALLLIANMVTPTVSLAQTGTVLSKTITTSGIQRTYIIYQPTNYNSSNTKLSLIFNFHGFNGKNTDQLAYGDFRKIADTAHILIICPQARTVFPNGARWETFSPKPDAGDNTFVNDILASLLLQYPNIDKNSVYATGISNGAFMAQDLGAFNPNFAAIASVAGDMTVSHLGLTHLSRTPMMEIHGTSDLTVPWAGTLAPTAGTTLEYYADIDKMMANWVKYNQCSTTPIKTSLPNISTTDNSTVEKQEYTNGNGGKTVLYKVTGGGHTWPGAKTTVGGGSGNTNQDFDASLAIWKFFRNYKLNLAKSGTFIENENSNTNIVSVYPNPSNGIFTLKSTTKVVSVEFTNILGVSVLTQQINAETATIDLSNNADGIYSLKIISEDGTTTQKIIVSK